jgi:YD repeat-containing protein
LGHGWTSSYGPSLTVDPASGNVTVTQESGATVTFYPDGSGGFEAPPRAVATLTQNANGYAFFRCNSTTMQFSTGGQLQSISDRNGYTTNLSYTGGNLTTVTDSVGRHLHFDWTGAHVSLVSDDSSPPRSVAFGYDASGNLTDYTDIGGSAWHYTYDSQHRLKTLRRPNQATAQSPAVTTNDYDGNGRVVTQTDELARATQFDYTSIPGSTKVTDPKGNVTVEAYQNLVRTALTRGYGTPTASTWSFEHDATLGVTRLTDPDNHAIVATYDRDGNQSTETDSTTSRLGPTTASMSLSRSPTPTE